MRESLAQAGVPAPQQGAQDGEHTKINGPSLAPELPLQGGM